MPIDRDGAAQTVCHITHTNEQTHDILRNSLDRVTDVLLATLAASGHVIVPSIEDKVVRFADKTSHQIFIEPEGLETEEVYPNGISTSLPVCGAARLCAND